MQQQQQQQRLHSTLKAPKNMKSHRSVSPSYSEKSIETTQEIEHSVLTYLKWQLRILKTIGLIPFYERRNRYEIRAPNKRWMLLNKLLICIKTTLCLFHIYILISPTVLRLLFTESKTDGISDMLDSSFSVLSNMIVSFMCMRNAKKIIRILNNFLKIDQLFEEYPDSPTVQKQYEHNYFDICMFAVFGYISIIALMCVKRVIELFSIHIFLYMTFYQIENAASCAYIVFISGLMHLLRKRFEFINQLLAQYNHKVFEKNAYTQTNIRVSTKMHEKHSEGNFRLFAKDSKFFYVLHNDLLDIFKLINSYAGFAILAFLLYVCYALLSCAYISSLIDFRNKVDLYGFGWVLSWIPLYVGILILLVNNCENATKEANKTSRILSRIYRKDREYQNIIDEFLLKCVKQEVRFTAYGFFSIDNSTMFKIFSLATSYLVILIQFKWLELSTGRK
ncbi:gustatory and pheromone receptor 32a-like [Eurosta solidaginis]|uniref:gustatory and pheromone receptor 32a-like n=1 Tax=Eurosta solidaginis TaxID=178769 RepID=UPI0035315FF3